MQTTKHNIPNQVCVCVDEVINGGITGRFYHAYNAKGTLFFTSHQLIGEMDAFFDLLGYPQCSVQMRSFRSKTQPSYEQLQQARAELLARKGEGDPNSQTGKLATFQVYVMFRQNATWQGELYWVEQEQSVNFRSALEFLELLAEAMKRD